VSKYNYLYNAFSQLSLTVKSIQVNLYILHPRPLAITKGLVCF